MFSFQSRVSVARTVLCASLSYALLISMCLPLSLASKNRMPSPASNGQSAGKIRYRARDLLVKFRPGATHQEKQTTIASYGTLRKKTLKGDSGVEQVEVLQGQDPFALSAELLAHPSIEFAEPNFLVTTDQALPSDSEFPRQWALRNTGQEGRQSGSDVNVTPVWQTNTGSPHTVIAVIDSGIDFTHPDLIHNRWTNARAASEGDLHGWDYVTQSPVISDEHGHGTSVAGIIAGAGNNGIGVSGVMWNASLMSLRVLDNTGTGDIANAVEAIDYAVQHEASVINISWGTNASSLMLKDALQRAIRRGVVVVCSAGNEGKDLTAVPYYPSSFNLPGLVSVAATDGFDQLTTWSNRGREVTVAAPGVDILTTKFGGGYWSVSGTSAAAPLVTGVVGLMKTIRPNMPANNIQKALVDRARHVAWLTGKVSAWGIVNAAESLASVHGPGSLPNSANSPRAFPTPGYGTGGAGPGGSFSTTPPPSTKSAAANLPNLNEIRNATPEQPKAHEPIRANILCADCDPLNGGGGGNNYPANDPKFSLARRQPVNETGQPGVDLGSRNFNWSLPLVELPGRAGLDLDLTLYYNSLVWVRQFPYLKYNPDFGSPAPGFQLGLPKLQLMYVDSEAQTNAYMMVTPSGGRVALFQVGTTQIYESRDSTYTQLDITGATPIVRSTDGTQYIFGASGLDGEYRCTQIKDRNGNYISATYNSSDGHLQTITDTLGRVVNVHLRRKQQSGTNSSNMGEWRA